MTEIRAVQGSIDRVDSDLIVVNLFEGVSSPTGATGAVDKALDGAISEVIRVGDFQGKRLETALLYTRGAIPAKRVLIVGLGKREDFDLQTVREAAAISASRARDLGVERMATIVHGGGAGEMDYAEAAAATAEGILLGLYRFDADKKSKEDSERRELKTVSIVELDGGRLPALQEAIHASEAVAMGVYRTRDLVNLPPNVASPSYLAGVALQIAEKFDTVSATVYSREEMAQMGMGAFLAVAQGSYDPPQFILLEYRGAERSEPPVVLVGKGITFDTGGISIKPSQEMWRMKTDMGGAAVVIGTLEAAARLGLPVNLVGLVGATYNMPDGNAYRPGDVVKAMNGKTIEVISTDAEGRMVLADLLSYASRNYKPKSVIDLATLTGGCVVALGKEIAGLFTEEEGIAESITRASESVSEPVWRMPMYEKYRELIKSDFADVKNSGGRWASAITAALFLQEFAEDLPWAHLDIAGPVWTDKPNPITPKGATGFGVRLLVKFLENLP